MVRCVDVASTTIIINYQMSSNLPLSLRTIVRCRQTFCTRSQWSQPEGTLFLCSKPGSNRGHALHPRILVETSTAVIGILRVLGDPGSREKAQGAHEQTAKPLPEPPLNGDRAVEECHTTAKEPLAQAEGFSPSKASSQAMLKSGRITAFLAQAEGFLVPRRQGAAN